MYLEQLKEKKAHLEEGLKDASQKLIAAKATVSTIEKTILQLQGALAVTNEYERALTAVSGPSPVPDDSEEEEVDVG